MKGKNFWRILAVNMVLVFGLMMASACARIPIPIQKPIQTQDPFFSLRTKHKKEFALTDFLLRVKEKVIIAQATIEGLKIVRDQDPTRIEEWIQISKRFIKEAENIQETVREFLAGASDNMTIEECKKETEDKFNTQEAVGEFRQEYQEITNVFAQSQQDLFSDLMIRYGKELTLFHVLSFTKRATINVKAIAKALKIEEGQTRDASYLNQIKGWIQISERYLKEVENLPETARDFLEAGHPMTPQECETVIIKEFRARKVVREYEQAFEEMRSCGLLGRIF